MISPMALIPNESYAAPGKVRDVFASKHWIGEGLLSNEVTNHRLLTVAPQHTSLVQRIEMLRHIGLGGVDFGQKFTHVFFRVA